METPDLNLELSDVSYFKHPSWRRVISQMREIFNKFHMRDELNRDENDKTRPDSINLSNICLETSQSYIAAIENELNQIKDSIVTHDDEIVSENFKLHLKVWKLCQIIFIKSSPSGTLLMDLQEWYRSTNNIDPLVQELFNNYQSNQNQLHQDQNYWPIILLAVAQGRIDTARHLLSFHSQAKSSSAFKTIDQLLRTMPTFQSLSHLSMFEFRTKWEYWQKSCIQALNNENFGSEPSHSLETICNMLCAVEKTFLDLKGIFNNWYYMLISYVSYANPTFNISDLHHHLSSRHCMNVFENELDEFDLIIHNIFDFDVENVIKDCSKLFSNNLFTAHLLDILNLNGKLQLNKQELLSTVGISSMPTSESMDDDRLKAPMMHEEHLIEYASQLISSYWSSPSTISTMETAFDYLLKCGRLGQSLIESYMDKIQLTYMSELNANKLFHIAFKLGLDDIAYQIGRVMQMRAFKQKQFGTSLGWNVRIKDSSFGNILAEKILDDYFQTNEQYLLDLTNNLSKEIIYCDRLIFLSKLREYMYLTKYSNRQEDNQLMSDYKKAANLIIELFEERGLVPFKYQRRLIFSTSLILKKGVFNEEQLTALLRVVQSFENYLEYFYDGSYKKSLLKMRPDLKGVLDGDDEKENRNVQQQTFNNRKLNENSQIDENENECSIDNYNHTEWKKLQIEISQRLAEEFVKRPINFESF